MAERSIVRSIIGVVVGVMKSILFHTGQVFVLLKKLLDALLRGTNTWLVMLGRLLMFSMLLTTGWIKMFKHWMYHKSVIRSIPYTKAGSKDRNLLDVYTVINQDRHTSASSPGGSPRGGAPVIIFIAGGAWIIGYKLWSCLIARAFSLLGAVVVAPDYRNFPQGDIDDMLSDIEASYKWTVEHIEEYGGDSSNIHIAGQSAGAQLCASLLAFNYERLFCSHDSAQNEQPCWNSNFSNSDNINSNNSNSLNRDIKARLPEKPCRFKPSLSLDEFSRIKTLICVSGPFNLVKMSTVCHKRGLDATILDKIFVSALERYSPTHQFNNIVRMIKRGRMSSKNDSNNSNSNNNNNNSSSSSNNNISNTINSSSSSNSSTTIDCSSCNNNGSNISTNININSCSSEGEVELEYEIHSSSQPQTEPPPEDSDASDASALSFPRVLLFHGSDDASIPSSLCSEFAEVLLSAGVDVKNFIYSGSNHTDFIVEGPLSGDNSIIFDIMMIVNENGLANNLFIEEIKKDLNEPYVSPSLVKLARWFNPF